MIVACIPAKGSSSRIPNKNKQLLGVLPLYLRAIMRAQEVPLIDRVIIDSDDDEILEMGKKFKATPLKRPKELANNDTDGNKLMFWEARNFGESDIIVQILPTSPFIEPATINLALVPLIMRREKFDSVVSVFSEPLYIVDGYRKKHNSKKIINSNELKPTMYETTGLYASRTNFVLRTGLRTNYKKCNFCEVSRIEAIDINEPEDLEFARIVWEGKNAFTGRLKK